MAPSSKEFSPSRILAWVLFIVLAGGFAFFGGHWVSIVETRGTDNQADIVVMKTDIAKLGVSFDAIMSGIADLKADFRQHLDRMK